MFEIAILQVQSHAITFAEWVSLLTLCLAPLIAHVLAGAPQPSLLVSARPKWHDRMCILNPTSILCRYAAIVDRRIRARHWEPLDAASANAIFWTQHGWNGSEDIVPSAFPLCTLLPDRGTVELVSTEMLKAIIVTMQGLQALVSLVGGATGTVTFNQYFGLDGIFGPLSIMGLLRLSAAPWLTDDFMYSTRARDGTWTEGNLDLTVESTRHSVDSLILTLEEKRPAQKRYRSVSHWPSRCFRVLYLSILIGCCFLASWWTFVRPSLGRYGPPLTASAFLAGLFYFFGLISTSLIFFYYYILDGSTSTLLPCASEMWYKIYTVVLMALMAIVILTSALETYKTACGAYTSLPMKCAELVCGTTGGETRGSSSMCQ